MSWTNNRTLDLDKLFVRDIIFKDASNRPISANQVLYSRGDGGTYFGNAPGSTNFTAFNSVKAGSNITIPASGASNTLWFQPGSGIEYYLDSNGGQPQLYIAALGPEQLVVTGGGSGVLNFSSLTDTLNNGRTLYYAGEGDTTIRISGTTVLFGSQYNSSLSTVQMLTSSLISSLEYQSTLTSILISTLSTADVLLISTGIAALYSTLQFTETIAIQTSSFVFSTFAADIDGNHTILNVNQINTNDVEAGRVNASQVNTYMLNIGSNELFEYNTPADIPQDCTVIASTGTISTYTNYLNVLDSYTNVEFAFQKQFLVSQSTFGTSTFQTFGEQVQLGFFPYLSTQGPRLPSTIASQFVPILQQIEVLEQNVSGSNSTITNYSLQNVAKLDTICANNSQLVLQGNVVISTLTVSTLNGGAGAGVGGSTFSFLFTDTIYPSTMGRPVTISSIQTSTINGLPYGTHSSLHFSTATGTNLLTSNATINQASISTALASTFVIQNATIQSESVSSARISSLTNYQLYGTNAALENLSTNNVSTANLYFQTATGSSAYISDLHVSTLTAYLTNTIHISTFNMSTNHGIFNTLDYNTGTGNITNTNTASTGTTTFGLASGPSVSTVNLSTANLGFFTSVGSTLRVQNASTGLTTFGLASGPSVSTANLSTANIGFFTATGSTLNVQNASTGLTTFGLASGPSVSTVNLSTANLGFFTAVGSTLQVQNASTGLTTFGLASGPSVSTVNLSTANLGFFTAVGSTLQVQNASTGLTTFDLASGPSVSTVNLSTVNLGFFTAVGSTLQVQNASTGLTTFGLASGPSVSTVNLSTANLGFFTAVGSTLNVHNASTGLTTFGLASGPNISTTHISTFDIGYNTAKGSILSNDLCIFSTVHFSTMIGWDAQISSLEVSTITAYAINVIYVSSYNVSTVNGDFENLTFDYGYGGTLNITTVSSGTLTYGYASGNSLSTNNLSTGNLAFNNASGNSVSTANLSTASLVFNNATGVNLSTTYISTANLSFENASGLWANLSAAQISTATIPDLNVSSINGLTIDEIGRSTFSTLYFSTAVGLNATISSIMISTVMGFDAPIFTFDMTNRRVGVNLGPTQQPRATMDVNGIVYATNFVTSSDRRLKSNISPLAVPPTIPRAYRYYNNETNEDDIGVMADEVESVLPECVYTRPDGFKSISYQKLVPLCLSLIQSLTERISALEQDKV